MWSTGIQEEVPSVSDEEVDEEEDGDRYGGGGQNRESSHGREETLILRLSFCAATMEASARPAGTPHGRLLRQSINHSIRIVS